MAVAEKVMGVQEVVERVEAVKAVEIEVANMAVGGKVVV